MIDATKQYKTRDGRAVRILVTDLKGNRPVVAALTISVDDEIVYTYYPDGCFLTSANEHPADLIEIREKRTAVVTITENGEVIATKEITYYVGEGLDKLADISKGAETPIEVITSK
jgi:hypothetical protein